MESKIKKELEDLKQYCIDYINTNYGVKNDYIKKTRITKNGLFIYGHKVYAPAYSIVYDIYTFISWYDSNDYSYINDMLEHFVLDCKRLKEYKESEDC